MIKYFCKSHRIEHAMDLVNEMNLLTIEPDEVCFNSLLDGCSKQGDVKLAKTVFDFMLNYGLLPTTVTFNSLIDCHARTGDLQEAWALIEKMQIYDIKPDNYTYSSLFKGIKSEKDLERAIKVYEDLREDKC